MRIKTDEYYTLKWIANITMIADHIVQMGEWSEEVYLTGRMIGRTAFPLFCFLLVKSFFFTEKKEKHMIKIGFLALLSELPFNVFTTGYLNAPKHQNVCFTLFLGFLIMFLMEKISIMQPENKNPFLKICMAGITAAAMLTAQYLCMDYGWRGILLIAMFYFSEKSRHPKRIQISAIIIFIMCSFLQGNMLFGIINIACLADIAVILYISSISKSKIVQKVTTNKISRIVSGLFYPVHFIILNIINRAF